MTDDELRAALAAADPARSADLDPLTSPRARELLERAMTSDLSTSAPARPSRPRWLAAAAAAAVLAGAAATYLAVGDRPTARDDAAVELALPGGDGAASMSCLPVQAELLADMPIALAGTVTAVSADEVRLDVTRWYRGGDADTVTLTNLSPDMQALLGATEFRTGQEYLVAATDGTVNACGFTGPAGPDLQRVYDEAFPG